MSRHRQFSHAPGIAAQIVSVDAPWLVRASVHLQPNKSLLFRYALQRAASAYQSDE
jgi:hypothetical protein